MVSKSNCISVAECARVYYVSKQWGAKRQPIRRSWKCGVSRVRQLSKWAEQVMRREPQLGAELRRDEKTKTRNENNRYDLHSQLKRNYSGSCGPGIRQSCHAIQFVHMLAHCALFWLLLIRIHLPQFFSFVPFWRGVHAPDWFSRKGASFQFAYFSPKYPYLPDISVNDGLLQVQHRFYYLTQ